MRIQVTSNDGNDAIKQNAFGFLFSFLNKHFLVKIKQSLKILKLNDYVC